MSKPLDPANRSLSVGEIRDFYALCIAFEAEGNSGHYTDYRRVGGFIYESKYVRFREAFCSLARAGAGDCVRNHTGKPYSLSASRIPMRRLLQNWKRPHELQ